MQALLECTFFMPENHTSHLAKKSNENLRRMGLKKNIRLKRPAYSAEHQLTGKLESIWKRKAYTGGEQTTNKDGHFLCSSGCYANSVTFDETTAYIMNG